MILQHVDPLPLFMLLFGSFFFSGCFYIALLLYFIALLLCFSPLHLYIHIID